MERHCAKNILQGFSGALGFFIRSKCTNYWCCGNIQHFLLLISVDIYLEFFRISEGLLKFGLGLTLHYFHRNIYFNLVNYLAVIYESIMHKKAPELYLWTSRPHGDIICSHFLLNSRQSDDIWYIIGSFLDSSLVYF